MKKAITYKGRFITVKTLEPGELARLGDLFMGLDGTWHETHPADLVRVAEAGQWVRPC